MVRSTLLHLLVQGSPKGKNPGSNISSDLEILNWKLKSTCNDLARVLRNYFLQVAGFIGVVSNVKVEKQKCFSTGRPKVRNSSLFAFLRHLGHHFQNFRRAARACSAVASRSACCFACCAGRNSFLLHSCSANPYLHVPSSCKDCEAVLMDSSHTCK